MGWCAGSEIAEDVWKLVRQHIPFTERREIARRIIDRFEQEDADTMDEAETLTADAAEPNIVKDEFFDRY